MFPVVAPCGTVTEMAVLLHEPGIAAMPLNVTALVLWVDPKFVPLIVMTAPIGPALIESVVIEGVGRTLNATALLYRLATKTWTLSLPSGALDGTTATIDPLLQVVMLADTPPMNTLLFPCVAPNPLPVMLVDEFTGP